jgi:hypothetical protein
VHRLLLLCMSSSKFYSIEWLTEKCIIRVDSLDDSWCNCVFNNCYCCVWVSGSTVLAACVTAVCQTSSKWPSLYTFMRHQQNGLDNNVKAANTASEEVAEAHCFFAYVLHHSALMCHHHSVSKWSSVLDVISLLYEHSHLEYQSVTTYCDVCNSCLFKCRNLFLISCHQWHVPR